MSSPAAVPQSLWLFARGPRGPSARGLTTELVFTQKLANRPEPGKQMGGLSASACLLLISHLTAQHSPWSQLQWVSCTQCRCWHRSSRSTWRSSDDPLSAHTSSLAEGHGSSGSQSAPTWCPRCNCQALREERKWSYSTEALISAPASQVYANKKYQKDGSAVSVWWCHAPQGLVGRESSFGARTVRAIFLSGSSVVCKTWQLSTDRTGIFQVPPALSSGSRLG